MSLDVTGIGAVSDFLGKVVDVVARVVPDKNQAAKIQEELFLAAQSGELQLNLGQQEINKVEAASTNWFVAGWRPFIGWICGLGLFYSFLAFPVLHTVVPSLQPLDGGTLLTCLGGILGMGGMRMNEKINGVAR